tara:strand:+ start:372 stop:890 length:519 start_codon:yes stop_codon:yes gene_type:complete
MEKNIRAKVSEHNQEFKMNVQRWIESKTACVMIQGENKTSEFLQYMNDFPDLELDPQDFQKRKRVKNNVPDYNRCIALKCNGERCSRKQKQDGTLFCGTHLKGANYGTIQQTNLPKKQEQIQLWLQEINGISRYIDKNHNIYCTEDILNTNPKPRIIAKYGVHANGQYFMIP